MPDRRYSILFYTAVLTAVAATYGVYHVLRSAQAKHKVTTLPVVVAAKDIPEGTSIGKQAVHVKHFPAVAVPEGAYSVPDSVVGRVLHLPVFAGEAIVSARLAPLGTGPGLEVKIATGYRAMAVKIDDVAGISGLIQPNSRVDVVVTLRAMDMNSSPVAKLFMENVRVLSVGTTVQRDVDGKPINATTAALEVTPEDAERLAVAANAGSIQLVLRGFGDPQTVTTPGAYTNDVVKQLNATPPAVSLPVAPRPTARRPAPSTQMQTQTPPPAPPPVVVRPESTMVVIYRGDKVEQKSFKKGERP